MLGEDPDGPHTIDTPRRVVKAFLEMTEGYQMSASAVLAVDFPIAGGNYDELILSRDIPFTSLCAHHLLPFVGKAHVAYIPALGGRVVGLSKLARLVDVYAKRLQVQEQMTMQIADALEEHLHPRGIAVVVKGKHMCQCLRGVKKDGWMVTSVMRGFFRENRDGARLELLDLLSV